MAGHICLIAGLYHLCETRAGIHDRLDDHVEFNASRSSIVGISCAAVRVTDRLTVPAVRVETTPGMQKSE